jgi:colanic acid/amylovoran biosynthesis glycosyltransferase
MTDRPSNSTLILSTGTYPYSAVEESFLDTEIPYLSSAYDIVTILPRTLPSETERTERTFPKNVYVDNSLLSQQDTLIDRRLYKLHTILLAITSRYFYSEILKNPWTITNITALKRITGYLSEALRTWKWTQEYAKRNDICLSKTVFYTHWLGAATMGIGMAKKEHPEIRLVSRAHGGDLYEERHDPPYIPYRYETFTFLDRLYLISAHGYNYLTHKYPHSQSKFEVARLGVEDPGFITETSQDGTFRVVSCSYIVPVKRIDLLIQGLNELGQKHPEGTFEWVHIGYGPLKEKMEDIAKKCFPKNISFHFVGYVTNPEVISFYQNNCVDVFINVSSSEGIPVSIMEAQSCGIPVIATAVGGNPEIVSNDVGILLSKNPTPQEIADAIWILKEDSSRLELLKKNSKSNWNKMYNAKKNYQTFSSKLNQSNFK